MLNIRERSRAVWTSLTKTVNTLFKKDMTRVNIVMTNEGWGGTREDRVQQFLSCAKPPSKVLAWKCLSEEYIELLDAGLEFEKDQNPATRENLVKEWADLQYVLSQFALVYDIPGEEAFSRVADNNMTKVQNGKVVYREDGKVMKPEGYVPADMGGL